MGEAPAAPAGLHADAPDPGAERGRGGRGGARAGAAAPAAAEVARVNAELVRPVLDRGGPPATVQKQLLWAFLLRSIQTRFYIHACTMRYCLQNRRTCRFWFPWPQQPEQQFDEENERVAYRRRYPTEDQ